MTARPKFSRVDLITSSSIPHGSECKHIFEKTQIDRGHGSAQGQQNNLSAYHKPILDKDFLETDKVGKKRDIALSSLAFLEEKAHPLFSDLF